jgi:hypothetical protein
MGIKLKYLLNEQSFSAKDVAKKIYDAKGFVWDNEFDAVKAILSIKDKTQYNQVQTELQKLTGGKGVGQYVSEFIVVRDSVNSLYGPVAVKYIKSIIAHLTKIGANPKSIEIFNKKLNSVSKWVQYNKDVADKGIGQTQFAWETAAIRSSKDPAFRHEYLNLLGMATSLIPVVGWAASAGIFSIDAADQYSQGNMREAGLSAIFAAIPVVGKGLNLLAKMPAVAQLGERGMAELGYKMATSGDPILTSIERNAIKETWKQQYILKNGLDKYMKVSLANQVQNGIVRDQIRNQIGERGANLMFKVADGTIKASAIGSKMAVGLSAFNAGIEKYQDLFDKYYAIPKANQNLKAATNYKTNVNSIFDIPTTPKKK